MTRDQFRKTTGKNIRRERMNRYTSIDKLASLLGLTSAYVGLIEHGTRGITAYNIYRIAEIFDIEIDKLYPSTDYKNLQLCENTSSNSKHKRLLKLSHELSDKELDFLIDMVKMLQHMRLLNGAKETDNDKLGNNDLDNDDLDNDDLDNDDLDND